MSKTELSDGNYLTGIRLSEWYMRSGANADETGGENSIEPDSLRVSFPDRFPYSRYTRFSTEFTAALDVSAGDRVLIRFSGMPYYTKYWMNGRYLGDHTGRIDAFTFDVTDCVKPGERNLVSVLCNNPSAVNDIDGLYYNNIGLSFTADPRVQEPAYVFVKPAVYFEDAVIGTDCENGEVSVELTVNNTGKTAEEVVLSGRLTENGDNAVLTHTRKTVTAMPGVSVHKLTVSLSDFRYWSPEDPFLYDGTFSVESENGTDTLTRRVAFRSFKVNDRGYFELNGKPYYIKAIFSGNVVEPSFDNGSHVEYYYKILTYLKSCGFNTVRALDTVQIPEVLDMCDKLGMLVYSEHPMAWHKVDGETGRVPEMFRHSVISTLRTIRSHPSAVIFGFQNETDVVTSGKNKVTELYEVIKTGPSWARDHAKDMVFMLSSGRFDGNMQLGSASNPGSYAWDGYMGCEGADKPADLIEKHIMNTYSRGMGDIHYYPLQPYGYNVYSAYKHLDTYPRGVIVSEAGSGSLFDIFATTAYRELNGKPTYTAYPTQISQFRDYFDKYGLDRIFASPEAVLRASNRLCGEQRARLLTYIRGAGKIGGYIMTGISDSEGLGEGIVNEYGKVKQGVTEQVTDGLSDLRFCIATDSLTYYSGTSAKLHLSVSDLKFELDRTKEYEVILKIRGENGTVWKKKYVFKPSDASFGTDIANEEIVVGFPAGKYTVCAEFCSGALANCTEHDLYVFDKANLSHISGMTVCSYGLDAKTKDFIAKRGAVVKEYASGDAPSVLLVGDVCPDGDGLAELVKLAEGGCHVVLLNGRSFIRDGSVTFPGISGKTAKYNNWLYHGEDIVYGNKITGGLQNRCLMDSLYYSSVYSSEYVYSATVPDDVSVATVFLGGNDQGQPFEFRGGYRLATYRVGGGYVTLNCLNIEGDLGNPVADTLLCNLVAYRDKK